MAIHANILAWRIPMDRAWQAIVHGVAKSQTWLSDSAQHSTCSDRHSLLSFKKNMYLFLAVLGLRCFTGFSLIAESRGYSSSCGARASHCGSFS